MHFVHWKGTLGGQFIMFNSLDGHHGGHFFHIFSTGRDILEGTLSHLILQKNTIEDILSNLIQ